MDQIFLKTSNCNYSNFNLGKYTFSSFLDNICRVEASPPPTFIKRSADNTFFLLTLFNTCTAIAVLFTPIAF